MRNPFRYFDSSPEVIRLTVMMYVRYPLSLRQCHGNSDSTAVRRRLAASDEADIIQAPPVRTENLNPDIVVMKSAKDRRVNECLRCGRGRVL